MSTKFSFEGELTEGKLEELRSRLYKVIDPSADSIIVYTISNPRGVEKRIWGIGTVPKYPLTLYMANQYI